MHIAGSAAHAGMIACATCCSFQERYCAFPTHAVLFVGLAVLAVVLSSCAIWLLRRWHSRALAAASGRAASGSNDARSSIGSNSSGGGNEDDIECEGDSPAQACLPATLPACLTSANCAECTESWQQSTGTSPFPSMWCTVGSKGCNAGEEPKPQLGLPVLIVEPDRSLGVGIAQSARPPAAAAG